MDQLLTKAGSQVVTFAVRSSISIASTYALKSVTKLINSNIPKAKSKDLLRLTRTKSRLQTRIDIISNAIDLIKLVASRGNTNLASTLRLINGLKSDIDEFDTNITRLLEQNDVDVELVDGYMLDLLQRIEEAIPLINLSLTTSGANLSGSLSNKVSPGRLLQASNYVNESNRIYKGDEIQVGPSFEFTLFSIFYHHGRLVNNKLKEITWKENLTKCDVSVWRVKDEVLEYKYILKMKENFNDGRYHDEDEESPTNVRIDVGTITRLFFSASGKLLKLEDRSSPVLVLKINHSFAKDQNNESKSGVNVELSDELDQVEESDEEENVDTEEDDSSNWVEWLALGEYEQLYNYDEDDYDSDEEDDASEKVAKSQTSLLKKTAAKLETKPQNSQSLSLLEYILRLSALQSNDQLSILEIDDERLSLYLNDEHPDSTTTVQESNDDIEKDNSTPLNIISRSKKSSPSLNTKLHNLSLNTPGKKVSKENENNDNPQTPSKLSNSPNSPIPGEISTNVKLTPWERDKLSRVNDPSTPSVSNLLRKKVLNRNYKSSNIK